MVAIRESEQQNRESKASTPLSSQSEGIGGSADPLKRKQTKWSSACIDFELSKSMFMLQHVSKELLRFPYFCIAPNSTFAFFLQTEYFKTMETTSAEEVQSTASVDLRPGADGVVSRPRSPSVSPRRAEKLRPRSVHGPPRPLFFFFARRRDVSEKAQKRKRRQERRT